ncbi:hypothetical protein ACFPVT_04950 [Corynebacterium choanae]|uniref:hypothetical protein n=1 Tax=Corynebacterium choanae TaxID=1862358 RepID=UPI0019D18715|nr:hypothetical protein [Corynebacterium choanae]
MQETWHQWHINPGTAASAGQHRIAAFGEKTVSKKCTHRAAADRRTSENTRAICEDDAEKNDTDENTPANQD